MAVDINKTLANLALSDSWHDFHGDQSDPERITGGLTAFNESMPSNAERHQDEDRLLGLVCQENLRELLDEPPGQQHQINTYTDSKFTSAKMSISGIDGETIAGLLPASIAMVVDFNQSGFLERLTRGDRTKNLTFYYLYNSEVENDPASKTPSTDPVFTSKKGIILKYLEQTGTQPTVYNGIPKDTPYNNDMHALEKFFSTHTLTLSPIQKQLMFGKGKKTSVTLTVTNANGTRVHHVPDAKKSNSIKSLLTEFLRKILQRRLDTPETRFGANVSWTQKRSGDWLQVLSCLDAHNRQYTSALPQVPVFFVTHDRVAMAYSLLMGVNTIFIKGAEKEIIVFTRDSVGNVNLDDLADEQVKNLPDRTTVLDFLQKFSAMRDKQISYHFENVKNATDIQSVFKSSLHFAHTLLDIPDVREIIKILTPPSVFGAAPKSQVIMKAYTTAKGIMRDHRGSPDFKASFDTYFERKDIFTALQRVTTPREIKTRLVAAFTGKIDKYSFLGYIAKVDTDEGDALKKRIFEKIEELKPDLVDLIANARVILQLKPTFVSTVITGEIIQTSNFQQVVESNDISMNQDEVVEANVHNDIDNDSTNHIADAVDPDGVVPEIGGKRRTRRNKRGGWIKTSRYANHGSSIDFPIKQTTHALIVAHILADPRKRSWCGMCGPEQRFRYESEIGSATRGSVVSERVDHQDPKPLEELGQVTPSVAQAPLQSRALVGLDQANILPQGTRRRRGIQGGGQSSDHLFPIYASLEALEPNVGERLQGSMDIDLYTRYYTFLQKLTEKVAPLTGDDKDALAFAMREVLFISAQHVVGRESIASCLGTTVDDMMSFASMSTILSNYICGEVPQYTPDYEVFVAKVLQMPVVVGVIRGAYTESLTVPPTSIPELSTAVKKLRADLAAQITRTDPESTIQDLPVKVPMRQIEEDPLPLVGRARRRTRRLTNDFLQSVRHQSIKMSSKRHSVSGKPFKR